MIKSLRIIKMDFIAISFGRAGSRAVGAKSRKNQVLAPVIARVLSGTHMGYVGSSELPCILCVALISHLQLYAYVHYTGL
jgi:hypothetical protein